ncbi:MAG: Glu-tRNA(Gln) amidotransferase subunit GatE [bacterium]
MDPNNNLENTKKLIGYLSKQEASSDIYHTLGFKSGLEIHQQITTEKKLFCNCPAGIYHDKNDYDAEVVRHMRPTLSELGEYDGTALMEFKTRKNIYYHINNKTACTYEIDDTPPFLVNKEALQIAIRIALLLKLNIVGEYHITRKQYLDGSIPTGFQRTGLVGIEGEIPVSSKKVRVIQLGLEEDACREVSDTGHDRVYVTDRLGMPLVEVVTYPDMETPDEVAEAANYIRYLTRSTGMVNTGIGAAREDVNVSITGGTRVEIKGVAHIKLIPELTHNEAFRQKALLEIKNRLNQRIKSEDDWKINYAEINSLLANTDSPEIRDILEQEYTIMAVNIPDFKTMLSFFTSPGRMFADEISDRIEVIACIPKPNMTHSESLEPLLSENEWDNIHSELKSTSEDAQIVFWGPLEDIKTGIETIEERCRLVFQGVPNETRKSMPDGTTVFERVLPGPDRMYPDTDSAPIPITEAMIKKARENLPEEVHTCKEKMKKWNIPPDCFHYILRNNLFSLLEKIIDNTDFPPSFVGSMIGHYIKHYDKKLRKQYDNFEQIIEKLFIAVYKKKLDREILKELIKAAAADPLDSIDNLLQTIGYTNRNKKEIFSEIQNLKEKFRKISKRNNLRTEVEWIMGQLREKALGNMSLSELRHMVEGQVHE